MNDNPYFQTHAEDYAEQIMEIQPELYQNTGRLLNQWLPSGGCVLDAGNGGVINYDITRLAQLDCIDLVVSQKAIKKYADHPNVRFLQGNILNLEGVSSGTYDAVIVQAVIHHLAGKTYKRTCAQVRTAMAECLRILKPGATLLIMESTVVPWFAAIERFVYPLMQAFFAICRFGDVYQFSPGSLGHLLENLDGATLLSTEPVEVGRFIWIMGKRIPRKLTPCGMTFYRIIKH